MKRRTLLPAILLVGLLIFVNGCGKSSKTGNNAAGGGGASVAQPDLSKASAGDVVKSYLAESGFADVQIESQEEKSTTFKGKPATAVHVKWRGKGDTETKDELFIVQDGHVTGQEPYDTAKSLEENVTATVHSLEKP